MLLAIETERYRAFQRIKREYNDAVNGAILHGAPAACPAHKIRRAVAESFHHYYFAALTVAHTTAAATPADPLLTNAESLFDAEVLARLRRSLFDIVRKFRADVRSDAFEAQLEPRLAALRVKVTALLAQFQATAAATAAAASATSAPVAAIHKELRDGLEWLRPAGGSNADAPALPVSEACLAKLRRAFMSNASNNVDARDVEQEFLLRVFLMLLRYSALSDDECAPAATSAMPRAAKQSGTGQQAAVPPQVLALLSRDDTMCVSAECFASPLNADRPRYCSAFRDTDGPFGSMGSFFSLTVPAGGASFECNPPFVEHTMLQAQLRIEQLLQQSSSADAPPLSFLVFLPHWADAEAIVNFRTKSKFLRGEILLRGNEHAYVDGSQHRVGATQYVTNHDSVIFCLQNDAGALKWPLTDAIRRDIVAAFAAAPTANATAATATDRRREREH